MARARNIKPAIMDNEQLAELPALTRLLFTYLWMLADREGRLEDRPKRIAAQALPYDRSADAEEMLAALQREGFVQRFDMHGKRIIQIVKFRKHQTPHGTEKDGALPDEDGLYWVHQRGKNGYATGVVELKNEAGTVVKQVSNKALTVKEPPDTGFTDLLIPDSPIPDTGLPEPSAPAAPAEASKSKRQRGDARRASLDTMMADGVAEKVAADWLTIRREKNLPWTKTAWDDTKAEAAKAGMTLDEAIHYSVVRSRGGFRAVWISSDAPRASSLATGRVPMSDAARQAANDESTAEALRLLLARRGGGEVIEGVVREVQGQKQIGGGA
ncbi:hypothetical protein [Roseateles sp.]|uniref:hypothetical protein n=1 Tax=Roseateles sp. TaxID=1971397 RepID=UPI00326556DE